MTNYIYFFVLLISNVVYANELTVYKGTVTTFEGNTVSGQLYAYVNKDNRVKKTVPDKISIRLKNSAGVLQTYDLNTEEIEKVIYSGMDLGESGSSSKYGRYYKTRQILVLKGGRRIEQESAPALLMPNNAIYVSSQHPLTGGVVYDRIYWSDVKEISLSGENGEVKVDSLGNTYPSDYVYSPYTGEKMKLESVND